MNEEKLNENVEVTSNEIMPETPTGKEKKNKKGIIAIVIGIILVIAIVLVIVFKGKIFEDVSKTNDAGVGKLANEYRMSGNGLEDFDLSFLKLENKKENIVYSPISIKYALEMLKEGTSGDSYKQLDALVGDYKSKKINNSKNISFANALFVKNSFKNSVNNSYITTLQENFGADVIFDSFVNANILNSWVKDKTLGLIDNMYDDISELEFILVNALAIDMDWVNVIQFESICDDSGCDSLGIDYYIDYYHANKDNVEGEYAFSDIIVGFDSQYQAMDFAGNKRVIAPEFAAVINNYDIVKTLGEENIRKIVRDALREWKKDNPGVGGWDEDESYADEEAYLDLFIKELDSNYKNNAYSTDFFVYDDEYVKTFAKNLKTYNGTTLQYVGIMPKKDDLSTFINKTSSKDLNKIINNLKDVSKANEFEDGYFTYVHGSVPLFNFDYQLDIMKDLKTLGITNVFNQKKADLSKITNDEGMYIDDVSHKATIDFSNRGIKAGAATAAGGAGNEEDGFDYFFKMPTKEIDLTFDNPYMFLIRDVDTGEVWFAGSVYEPTKAMENEGLDW